MSETTDQFRNRIGKLNYEAKPHKHEVEDSYGEYVRTESILWEHLPTFHEYLITTQGFTDAASPMHWMKGAERVYEQALRDLIALSFMTYIPGTDDLAPIIAVSQIKRFAADRGIDLGDDRGEGDDR